MTTFFGKARTFILGTAHDLLDKAIDMNSPVMVKQYARDLGEALQSLKSEAIRAAGQVATLEREYRNIEAQISKNKELITKALAKDPNNMSYAREKGALVITLTNQLKVAETSLETQKQASSKLDEATSKLEGKYRVVVARVKELERMDRTTKGKEHAADALEAAGRLIDAGADTDIDDVASQIQANSDVANEKFNRAMDAVNVDEDPDAASQVDELLESLKPKTATAQK